MSSFTTTVRYICEQFAEDSGQYTPQSSPARDVDRILTLSAPKVFDFDYPIFDSTYKEHLEKKILRHYYFREIGSETYGRWQVELDSKMNEIMPYFNQLYKSELLEIEPLLSYKHTEHRTHEDHDTSKDTNSGNDKDEFNDNIQDTFGKTVTNSGADTFRETPRVSDTQIRTPNLTHAKTGTVGSEGSTEQTSDNIHKQTDWDITSDTPQGGLNNITGGSSAVATPGIPHGGMQYASQISERTAYSEDREGRKTNSNTDTYNTTDKDTGSETLVTTHDGQNINTTEHGHKITDGGTQSQAHTGNIKHNFGRIVDGKKDNNGLEDITSHGFNQSQAELLQKFRETMLNIDMMVIDALSDLFLGLYNLAS